MKTFKSNRKNTGAAGVASKACAWILSIMLVVTGLAPSFAANDKAGKGNASVATKVASKAKVPSKTEVTTKDKATSKTKTTNKPDADKKDVSSSSKKQKTPKNKDDGNGKKKKFKNNKQEQTFKLNASGNVNATLMNGDLLITVKNSSGDANIDRSKWIEMVKALGGSYDKNSGRIDWSNASDFGRIYFPYSSKVYLPKDSSTFFLWI